MSSVEARQKSIEICWSLSSYHGPISFPAHVKISPFKDKENKLYEIRRMVPFLRREKDVAATDTNAGSHA